MPIKVTPISPIARKNIDITSNGVYDVAVYSSATVNVPQKLTKVPFNIKYGNNPPKDTSALWIKGPIPDKVTLGPKFGFNMEAEYMKEKLEHEGLSNFGCVKYKKYVYIFGGYSGKSLDTIIRYDLTTKKAKILDVRLPHPVTSPGCAEVDGKIYIIGGYSLSSSLITHYKTIHVFDIASETIKQCPQLLPECMSSMATIAVEGKIYIFGGRLSGYSHSSSIYVFYPSKEVAIDYVRDKNNKPINFECGCYGMAPVEIDKVIYLVGGFFTNKGTSNKIHRFNLNTRVLDICDVSMPVGITDAMVANINNHIYIFGGDDNAWISNKTFVYDPFFDNIFESFGDMKLKLYGAGCVVDGGVIHIIGGANRSGRYDWIHSFTVKSVLKTNTVYIDVSESNNIYTIYSGDNHVFEIGIDRVYRGNNNGFADVAEAYLFDGVEWKLIE